MENPLIKKKFKRPEKCRRVRKFLNTRDIQSNVCRYRHLCGPRGFRLSKSSPRAFRIEDQKGDMLERDY